MVAAASPHPVAPFEGVPRLLQQVDHHLLGEEGLPVGVNAGAQGQVGALPDPLLQLLDAAESRATNTQRKACASGRHSATTAATLEA